MKNVVQRTVTGVIFLILVIGGILLGKTSFFILFELIIALALYEFYTLAEKKKYSPLKIYGTIIGMAIFAVNFLVINQILDSSIFLWGIPLMISIFIAGLYRKTDNIFVDIGFTLIGIIYIAMPLSIAANIVAQGNLGYNTHLLLGFLVLTWSYDTLAYVFGISFGKHRLFERISPKKSWEGFIGGTISGIGMAYLTSLFLPELSFLHWALVSLMIAVFGTYGDLVESSFKRNIDEKDSGSILPGHGGILDRFDAVLFTLPLFYLYLQYV